MFLFCWINSAIVLSKGGAMNVLKLKLPATTIKPCQMYAAEVKNVLERISGIFST